jgi:hypothetical protein
MEERFIDSVLTISQQQEIYSKIERSRHGFANWFDKMVKCTNFFDVYHVLYTVDLNDRVDFTKSALKKSREALNKLARKHKLILGGNPQILDEIARLKENASSIKPKKIFCE